MPTSQLIAVVLVLGALPSGAAAGPPDPCLPDGLLQELGSLAETNIVNLDLPESLDAPTFVEFSDRDRSYTIDLVRTSLRAPGFRLLTPTGAGAMVESDAAPPRTFRGTIRGIPGSVVAGSLLDDGLYAAVRWPSGDRVWIQPLVPRVPDGPALHVVYRSVIDPISPARCAVASEPASRERGRATIRPRASAADGGAAPELYLAPLACDADYEYYVSYNSSVPQVVDRIEMIINTVNVQYEDQAQISHRITAIVVRTDSQDPYTETDIIARLAEFRCEWNTNHADVPRALAHLFSARNYCPYHGYANGIGEVCNVEEAYCISWSDWVPVYAFVTNLTAHETGHLWGATHCFSFGDCFSAACEFTMDPCNASANNEFASGGGLLPDNVGAIISHRDSISCLQEVFRRCPTGFEPVGETAGGGVGDLCGDDGNEVVINGISTTPLGNAPNRVGIEVSGTTTVVDPASLRFDFAGYITGSGFTQLTYFYNHVTRTWDLVDRREADMSTGLTSVTVSAGAAAYVEDGMLASVVFEKSGSPEPAFELRADEATWAVTTQPPPPPALTPCKRSPR